MRHDAAAPFTVTSHGFGVQDGTVFDLSRDGARLSVAVAEGTVTVEPQRNGATRSTASIYLDDVQLNFSVPTRGCGCTTWLRST